MKTGHWKNRFGIRAESEAAFCEAFEAIDSSGETELSIEALLSSALEKGLGLDFLDQPHLPAALARLAYASPFLLRYLTGQPGRLAAGVLAGLDEAPALLPWDNYHPAGNSADWQEAEVMKSLRVWKYDNYARLTSLELLELNSTSDTCTYISLLADGIIQTAYRYAFTVLALGKGLPVRHDGSLGLGAVIGMGKLGGMELNYASDIDLIFIHDADNTPCQPLISKQNLPGITLRGKIFWEGWRELAQSTREQCAREQSALADSVPPADLLPGPTGGNGIGGSEFHHQLARKVVLLIGHKTSDGIGFRVDVDLRPQGKSGLLVPSLGFLEQYYDSFGREWERAAMIKARQVAGADSVYRRFNEIITPFVYRRYLDYGVVEGIAIVKHDINRNHRGRLEGNLKLGLGGIRENEFFVQALQLLHGGKDKKLRPTKHAEALKALVESQVISKKDGEAHLADYWLLRKYENRLQMVEEAQTHDLPETSEARLKILHDFRPGFPDRLADCEKNLEKAREGTSHRFQELFSGMGQEEYPDPSAWQETVVENIAESQKVTVLDRIDGIMNSLMTTRIGERCVFKVARLLSSPEIYQVGTEEAFPHWLDFFDQIGNRNTILTLIEANPAIVNWVSTFFAEGGRHAQLLIRHPEFLESYLTFTRIQSDPQKEVFQDVLERVKDEEEFILELQKAKSQSLLQILASYLNDPLGLSHRSMLSNLAEATVDACTRFAWRLVTERNGIPAGKGAPDEVSGFVVLAMGKLGSREMHFSSDIDLAFVYHEEGTTSKGKSHFEFFRRLAQKIGNLLTSPTQFGKLYEIDYRLRPFGKHGLLAPNLRAFTNFLSEAEVWNFQAFTRIRLLSGDRGLAESVIGEISKAWRNKALPAPQVAGKVREMLGRLVSQHTHQAGGDSTFVQLKYDLGGMIGFEFLKQLYFLTSQKEQGWTAPEENERIKVLGPSYNTICALDERLSFYQTNAHHRISQQQIGRVSSIDENWHLEKIRAIKDELEKQIEEAFGEYAS